MIVLMGESGTIAKMEISKFLPRFILLKKRLRKKGAWFIL